MVAQPAEHEEQEYRAPAQSHQVEEDMIIQESLWPVILRVEEGMVIKEL